MNRFLIIMISLLFFASCKKQDEGLLPVVNIVSLSALTDNSVNFGCALSNNSGAVVSVQGVCWSTSENPTISDNKTSDSLGRYSRFRSSITELTPVTVYYVRAYVTINDKTSYSEQQSFTTLNTVKDNEGNEYHTVKIGSQIWMKENLKVTKFQNGDDIGTTDPPTLNTSRENEPKYQWLMPGDDDYLQTYGRLYTWYTAVDPRNVCPSGWHIPDNGNWHVLLASLYSTVSAGAKMKEAGTAHWTNENTQATNVSGFTALPAGFRLEDGEFSGTGSSTVFWSSDFYSQSQGMCVMLTSWSSYANVDGGSSSEKIYGYSIRCIKDE
jgi:uncharacterized protein (TIGR02145 family)